MLGVRLWCCAQMVVGPGEQETLLAGLQDGCVLQICLDDPFPVCLLQHSAPIRCQGLLQCTHGASPVVQGF